MPFPSPPWSLEGTAWVSLLPVTTGTPARPAGLYAAAFVDYTEGSVLTYRELAVARVLRPGTTRARVTVTDIWVTSAESRAGGRSLWAIPKEIADLHQRERQLGPLAHTTWDAGVEGRPLAAARFTGPQGLVARTPVRVSTHQQRDDGTPAEALVTGSAATAPCLAQWDFGEHGPLSWLAGIRPVLSLRHSRFRISIGAR